MKTALLVISLKNKVIDEALKGPISDALKRGFSWFFIL